MSTAAQIHANRENSQKSTGPTSAAGQQASSENATKHGLASHSIFCILPDEDPDQYLQLLHNLKDEHQPQTQTERDLVYRLAQHEWLRARALRFQSYCFEPGGHVASTPHFALYLRYQTTNERAYSRCLKDLLMLRAEKRKVEIGFVSQNRSVAADQRAAELHNLKKQEFELKKERTTRPAQTKESQNAPAEPVPHPQSSPGDLQMAA